QAVPDGRAEGVVGEDGRVVVQPDPGAVQVAALLEAHHQTGEQRDELEVQEQQQGGGQEGPGDQRPPPACPAGRRRSERPGHDAFWFCSSWVSLVLSASISALTSLAQSAQTALIASAVVCRIGAQFGTGWA